MQYYVEAVRPYLVIHPTPWPICSFYEPLEVNVVLRELLKETRNFLHFFAALRTVNKQNDVIYSH
jgi:hypothetical protein